MENIYIEKEVRMCYYRHCNKPIPETRRSDAFSCCDEHGWNERNLRDKDNLIKKSKQKATEKNNKIIWSQYELGNFEVPKLVLKYLDFDFGSVFLVDLDLETGIIVCTTYDFKLTIEDDICKITKL